MKVQYLLGPGVRAAGDVVREFRDIAVLRIVHEYTQRHNTLRVTDGQQDFIRAKRL